MSLPLPPHIRVRCADGHPLIYERPEAQAKGARQAMTVVTWIGWGVWVYLWRPVLTLLLWVMGIRIAQHQWIDLSGWTGLIDFAYDTMPYGWALCAALLIWATVNYLRFHGKERRKARALPSVDSDARWTGMTPGKLAAARGMKDVVCIHDEHGVLVDVEARFREADVVAGGKARVAVETLDSP
ncbi:poly-beta-1,6-N-acetyl-D-glucosamine biosynthesis protein PgaD [Azoarcus sp. DN11]|uniref:poly-beta-1,6-N-acetyl-D-glucosamine biosynthesis protein PgaD n=1 Tax=Azoarcus sp. DN11 TaxID=356837 RepID=UPI000EB0C548|nr:poly-beta-1,6-N-acetyl-D-glucosamine biosynthesis protein PgaD [Azoarcus sp. DN11]AYH46079.1 poly-beta-1,6-N-acetyl-D-glucosamine biosynthesis protein PgaD [Azoarcus sp. DN11]